MMRRNLFGLSVALLGILSGCGGTGSFAPASLLTTILSDEQPPSNDTGARGTASISTEGGRTHVVVNATGLWGSVSGAKVRLVGTGTTGASIIDLFATGGGITGTTDVSKAGELTLDKTFPVVVPGLATNTHYVVVQTSTPSALNFATSGQLRGTFISAKN